MQDNRNPYWTIHEVFFSSFSSIYGARLLPCINQCSVMRLWKSISLRYQILHKNGMSRRNWSVSNNKMRDKISSSLKKGDIRSNMCSNCYCFFHWEDLGCISTSHIITVRGRQCRQSLVNSTCSVHSRKTPTF